MPQATREVKQGQTLKVLERIAQAETDTAEARRMQQAKQKLFVSFRPANTAR